MQDLTGQLIDRYHIIEKLGEGGMAVVYKAYDTRLDCDAAVKVIRMERLTQEMASTALTRFEREAKEVARLTHPNIVKVTDYGEYNGTPYLVMPYLEGGTIKQMLGKPMPYAQAARLLAPIAEALAYAHRKGIIHRDVKPSNILITEDGQPMLSDFGVAKILDLQGAETLTGTGMGLGTPEYMAPEQWVGKFSPAVDIYSLGVVFYELITGRKPYTAETPAAVLLKQATEPLPRPKELVPGLPEEVEHVLFKALAKKPEDRYVSMADFASALSRLTIGGESAILQPVRQVPITQGKPETDSLETVDQFTSESPGRVSVKPVPTPAMVRQKDAVQHKTAEPMRVLVPAIAGVVVVAVLILGGLNGWFGGGAVTTVAPKAIQFSGNASVPIESLVIGATQTGKDGMVMVYVPGGTFMMGSPDDVGDDNEHPLHEVTLDAFWIDQTEVTNEMYQRCVEDGACTKPLKTNSYSRDSYYGANIYSNYPVIYVDWEQANAYCSWAERELPTEAQWEYAARGPNGFSYPWGNDAPTCGRANFHQSIGYCAGDTTAVDNYEFGKSWVGAYNLAGNVWEWVQDWYAGYPAESAMNPKGPITGDYKVLRGGSRVASWSDIRSTYRFRLDPSVAYSNYGFRCSLSTTVTP